MPFQAVLFDAGDTLVRPFPSFHELFAQVMLSRGYPVDPGEVSAAWPVAHRRFAEAAGNGEGWSTSPERSKRFWLSVYEAFLDELGIADGDGCAVGLYEAFSDRRNYRLFPDVMPSLKELSSLGYEMGVVSNFETWLDPLLDDLGAAELLPVRAISGIEGIEKPDPELFRLAVERIGVPASGCVYVGDSVDFDVEPARSIGMFPVLLDRRERFPTYEGPRVTSLEQLSGVIATA